MKKLITIALLLALISLSYATPINFDSMSSVASTYGRAAVEASGHSLTAYANKVYYSTFNGDVSSGSIYEYDPSTGQNTEFLSTNSGRFLTLSTVNNMLYASDEGGTVYRYDGSTTSTITNSPFSATDSVRSLTEHNGNLFFGTTGGNIYRYDGADYEQVLTTDRYVPDIASWGKDGYMYASIGSSGNINNGWVVRSSTGNAGSWETILQDVYRADMFMPTEDDLYMTVTDNVFWYDSTVRKSNNGTDFTVISQSNGNLSDPLCYKAALGAFYNEDIAYFFENSYEQTNNCLGSIISEDNGVVSQTANTSLQFIQAIELDGTIYALATDNTWGSGNVQLMAIPEPCTMIILGLGGLFLRKRK